MKHKQAASWLELAVAPSWRLEQSEVSVHPMEGEGRRCFAMTLGEQWLCGSDSALSVFDTYDAASRFLTMLNVPHFSLGTQRQVNDDQCDNFQCFRLGRQGLTPCEECEAGRKRYQRATAPGFDYWGDD
jgi:hypothetical protein